MAAAKTYWKEVINMSAEESKAILRRWFEEVWDKRNLAAIDEIVSDNFVFHNAPPGISPDREGVRQLVTMMQAAFPDVRITVEDQIGEGDKVVTRWTFAGTHKGELMGIAPTGKQVTTAVITINRIAGGKAAEAWEEVDRLGMMQQLGVVPPMGEGKE